MVSYENKNLNDYETIYTSYRYTFLYRHCMFKLGSLTLS